LAASPPHRNIEERATLTTNPMRHAPSQPGALGFKFPLRAVIAGGTTTIDNRVWCLIKTEKHAQWQSQTRKNISVLA